MTFFEWLLGIHKTQEQIKQETKERNEDNYRNYKIKVLKESREFKNKYKKEIEYYLKKSISKVSLKELIFLGFHSDNLTKKHCDEIFRK